jgi:hypothetical protein
MGRWLREEFRSQVMTSKLDGIVEACGVEKNYKRQDSRGAGVDEEDVHRSIRRVRLGFGQSSGR